MNSCRRSSDPLIQAQRAYKEKFGEPAPWQAMKLSADVGTMEQFRATLERAVQDGKAPAWSKEMLRLSAGHLSEASEQEATAA